MKVLVEVENINNYISDGRCNVVVKLVEERTKWLGFTVYIVKFVNYVFMDEMELCVQNVVRYGKYLGF